MANLDISRLLAPVALALLALSGPGASSAAAQSALPIGSSVPGAAAKRAAHNAANAANAQLAAQMDGASAPVQQGSARPAPTAAKGAANTAANTAAATDAKAAKPVKTVKTATTAKAGTKAEAAPDTSHAAKSGAQSETELPQIMRESFAYQGAGRRDPFVSLMGTAELRPVLSDLRLTGILYDPSGRRPVAIMRENGTDQQYRVTTGMTLGRMRVAQIKPKSVTFVIEEFGFSRRDSLVLVDSTRMRTP